MKKLIIPAFCVGTIITVSMLDAGITPVQKPEQMASVAPVVTNVQPATPVQPAVEQLPVVQKNTAAPEQPKTDVKENASEKDEFSDEEFKKQIAELEKLFAEMEKEAKAAEKNVEAEKTEQKTVDQKTAAESK